MLFPNKSLLSALTGKPLTRTKRTTLTNYNINLNQIYDDIMKEKESLIKNPSIRNINKVLRSVLSKHQIKYKHEYSSDVGGQYWVEGEYDTLFEDMTIKFCINKEIKGKPFNLTNEDVFILASFIPCIIAHECMHITQHYRRKFEGFLFSKTPSFETQFDDDLESEYSYLLEDIELEAFTLQSLLEYKSLGATPSFDRYKNMFAAMNRRACEEDKQTIKTLKTLFNAHVSLHASKLGITQYKKILFKNV